MRYLSRKWYLFFLNDYLNIVEYYLKDIYTHVLFGQLLFKHILKTIILQTDAVSGSDFLSD